MRTSMLLPDGIYRVKNDRVGLRKLVVWMADVKKMAKETKCIELVALYTDMFSAIATFFRTEGISFCTVRMVV